MAGLTQPYARDPSPEIKRNFLERLVEVGNVTVACAQMGLARPSVYYWKHRDREFRQGWEMAMAIFQDQLSHEVIDTARALGVGRWVPAKDADGEPILDDDFEPNMVLDVSHVDARILSKLIDKRVPSVDGPNQTNVQVHNLNNLNTADRPMPRLVGGSSGSTRSSVTASKASGALNAVSDAEIAQESTQKPRGNGDER